MARVRRGTRVLGAIAGDARVTRMGNILREPCARAHGDAVRARGAFETDDNGWLNGDLTHTPRLTVTCVVYPSSSRA